MKKIVRSHSFFSSVLGLSAVALFVTASVLSGQAPAPAAATAGQVTFTHDVAPILYKSCIRCHRPGEIAPMSFMSYQEARPWAKAIKEAVLTKKMPPWFAEGGHRALTNERGLSKEDIDTLVAWSNNGAPEGDAKDKPAPVKFVRDKLVSCLLHCRPPFILCLKTPAEAMPPATGRVRRVVPRSPALLVLSSFYFLHLCKKMIPV